MIRICRHDGYQSLSPRGKDSVVPSGPMVLAPQGRPIVVLGQGFAALSRAGGPRLTLESRFCALAAARLLAEGRTPLIVFSGGHTAGPNHPSEAEAMWRYARRHAPVQAASRVRLEEASIDTADNAHHVSILLGRQGVVLVAPAPHLRRASHYFRRHGFAVDEVWDAETLVEQVSARHARLVLAYRHSARSRLRRYKEALLRALLMLDPGGLVPRVVTHCTRHGRTAKRPG
jgi:uncharacterized SAM-binding protein YcdF (DUF218 family)